MRKCAISTIVLTLGLNTLLIAADWAGFRGTERTGVSSETNLMKSWPANGPQMLWVAEKIGIGWSAPVISNGRVYATGMNADTKAGILSCWNTQGKSLWQKNYGPEWKGSFAGARTTPTLSDNKLYLHSGNGLLCCFDAITGDSLWKVDTNAQFKWQRLTWGVSDSVLIVGDSAICTPGGEKASLAAFNKNTGKLIWATTSLTNKGAYCSPIYVPHKRKPQVVTILDEIVVGVDISNGNTLWTYPYGGKSINPVSPVYHDNQIFVTSGYNDYGALLQLDATGTQVTEVWKNPEFDTHHGGVLLLDGYLYGTNWQSNSKGKWVCADWKTGKFSYQTSWDNKKGPIIAADGMLYCYDEKNGNVALVPANPKAFNIISQFKITRGQGQHWAHPAISDGVLYIRHGEFLMAYDIKAR